MIETGYYPQDPVRYVVWDGTDEALADVTELLGVRPRVEDGVLFVVLASGEQSVPSGKGWAVYVQSGAVGVMAGRRVAELRASTAA